MERAEARSGRARPVRRGHWRDEQKGPMAAVVALLAVTGAAAGVASPPCRDRFLSPFSSTSIWNTAIGSNAVFSPAKLYESAAQAPPNFHNDQDFFLMVTAISTTSAFATVP